jgi:hypothetical protein
MSIAWCAVYAMTDDSPSFRPTCSARQHFRRLHRPTHVYGHASYMRRNSPYSRYPCGHCSGRTHTQTRPFRGRLAPPRRCRCPTLRRSRRRKPFPSWPQKEKKAQAFEETQAYACTCSCTYVGTNLLACGVSPSELRHSDIGHECPCLQGKGQ